MKGAPGPIVSVCSTGAYVDSEISILAKSRRDAQYALKLILLGDLLANREQPNMALYYVVPPDESEPSPEDHPAFGQHRLLSRASTGLTNAALIGARLSQRKSWQSAAWKYFYACDQCPIEWRDTHPYYSDYRPISGNPEEFIRYANSIVAAYSVMEHLGFEIRASKDNPSILADGSPNRKVREDVHARLRDGNVNPEWPVVWQVRAPLTRLTMKRKVPGTKADWATRSIRDKMIPTIDALYHDSFLRSKVGAHAANSLTKSLSIYDVHNVQQLAWCILMQTIGCG